MEREEGITEMACGEAGTHFRQTTMGTKEKIKNNYLNTNNTYNPLHFSCQYIFITLGTNFYFCLEKRNRFHSNDVVITNMIK